MPRCRRFRRDSICGRVPPRGLFGFSAVSFSFLKCWACDCEVGGLLTPGKLRDAVRGNTQHQAGLSGSWLLLLQKALHSVRVTGGPWPNSTSHCVPNTGNSKGTRTQPPMVRQSRRTYTTPYWTALLKRYAQYPERAYSELNTMSLTAVTTGNNRDIGRPLH